MPRRHTKWNRRRTRNSLRRSFPTVPCCRPRPSPSLPTKITSRSRNQRSCCCSVTASRDHAGVPVFVVLRLGEQVGLRFGKPARCGAAEKENRQHFGLQRNRRDACRTRLADRRQPAVREYRSHRVESDSRLGPVSAFRRCQQIASAIGTGAETLAAIQERLARPGDAPLDDQLLFTRAGKNRFSYRSNQFVVRAEQKANREAKRIIAFDHIIGSGWDLANLPLDKPLQPGKRATTTSPPARTISTFSPANSCGASTSAKATARAATA